MSDTRGKLVVLLSLVTLAGPAAAPFAQQAQEAPEAQQAELRASALAAMPRELDIAVRAALLPEAYAIRADAVTDEAVDGAVLWSALNAGLGLRVAFADEAVCVESTTDPGELLLRLQLLSWGRVGDQQPPDAASIVAAGARLEYRRGPLVEWYLNAPEGIEQGFTLAEPPYSGDASAPIELRLALGGPLTPAVLPDGLGLLLHDASGVTRLHYSGLAAWDADGQPLAARLELVPGGLAIRVQDEHAAYPLTIDPLIAVQEGSLLPCDAAENDFMGSAVAVSGDTALAGAPSDDTAGISSAGSVHVFVRSGTSWTEQAQLAPALPANARFGTAVALSGNTAVVGAPGDTGAVANTGAAYVFVRSGTTWTQQAKLTATDGVAGDHFGEAVAVALDTALVGSPDDDTPFFVDAGTVSVYVRSGTVWSQQGAKLVKASAAAGDRFGTGLALSGDTAVVGAPYDDTAAGADAGTVAVLVRSGTTWAAQGGLLTASDGAAGDNFGQSVGVDGDTLLAGSPYDDTPAGTDTGSAHVFVRSGTTWSAQGAKLTPSAGAEPFFGNTVALSGNTAAMGAGMFTTWQGSAYVFVRSGVVWSQQGTGLAASDGMSFDNLGRGIALSGDTLIAGAPGAFIHGEAYAGAAYAFTRTGVAWSEQAKLAAGAPGAGLGFAVALSGDTALVGAHNDENADGIETGAAYVFVRNGATWSHQARLLASDGAVDDDFGLAVGLAGDTAIVGARLDDSPLSNAGSAYVFVRSGTIWTQQQKLVAPDAAVSDEFGGYGVAVSGNRVIVGARQNNIGVNADAGSAYVFLRTGTTWNPEGSPLLASDGAANDLFGWRVAIDGDTAIVAAPSDDTAQGVDAGSAYVFVRSGANWNQQQKLAANDGAAGDHFGSDVALSGNTALVGAAENDTAVGTDAGTAYVFQRSGVVWVPQGPPLVPFDAAAIFHFGAAVALDVDRAVIGALNVAVYVFDRAGTTWTQGAKIKKPVLPFDVFGSAVAVDGDTALVGAWQGDTAAGPDAGSAYVFRLLESEMPWVDLGSGLPGVGGTPRFVGEGTLVAGTPGSLLLAGAKPSAACQLHISLSSIPKPFKGGVLLAWPPVSSILLVTLSDGTLPLPFVWPVGIPPGTQLWFQYSIADPAAIQGVALSNALKASTP